MADLPTTTNPTGLQTDISSIIALITGLTGAGQGNFTNAANRADPWGPNRGRYMDELNTFMTDPSSVLKDPAFLAAQNVGAENISRQAGAAGMSASGNRLADLFKFGQSSALDFEQQKFRQLADLAGVNAGSPVAAAGFDLMGHEKQGQNLSQGIAGVIPIIAQLLGLGGKGLADILKGFGGGGTPDLSSLLTSGGINAGTLDPGGTLGDFANIDYGGGDLGSDWFTGGNGDIFQIVDVLGG